MIQYIRFSDVDDGFHFIRDEGKAMQDLCNFFNKHREFKIIEIIPRQQMVDNAGAGKLYYSLDVLYEAHDEEYFKWQELNIYQTLKRESLST